jgi:hypothetical protein
LPGPDLTMNDFSGISCGAQTCDSTTDECCVVLVGMNAHPACVNKGTCQSIDGGAGTLACDGPEDCPGAKMPSGGCCVALNGSTGMLDGASMCTDQCPGKVIVSTGTGINAHTKMCHTAAECTGYVGAIMGTPLDGNYKFDQCCTFPQAPAGFAFCVPGLVSQLPGGGVHCL